MSVLWTADEAARATAGHTTGSWQARGVSIDSRTIATHDLFVALEGPHRDGHDYVETALEQGAAAAMVARGRLTKPLSPLLEVDDTLEGLCGLARASRARSKARIIAVTGSVGKTGTKEALHHVLAAQSSVYANVASFNNHWGVPLSLARLAPEIAYGVFEIGMNHAGEITPLTRMVRPHVALVTTVEAAHLEFFGSIEAIAHAKAEIFQGLETGGVAVLNADNAMFGLLRDAALAAGAQRIIAFGETAAADVRLLAMRSDATGSDVEALIDGQNLAFRIGIPGRHWIQNSLGVLAGCRALGADLEQAATALRSLNAPAGRGTQHRLSWGDGTITVLDESYNANPASVRAALDVLGRMPGRRVAVLGDMLELGETSPELHAELRLSVENAGVSCLFTAGPLMRHLHDAAAQMPSRRHADDAPALAGMVASELQPGDVVLIKGSLGSRMKLVLEAIMTGPQTGGGV